MFNSGLKQACKEYVKMISILQQEKTDLFNRLTARSIQELQLLQNAFTTQDELKSNLSIYTEDDDNSHLVGEVMEDGSEISAE